MTNERFNDDVVPGSETGTGGMSSGASAADSEDMPRGTGLTDVTGDTVAGDTNMNADPDFGAGADYTGDTDLTVDRASGNDNNLGDLSDPGHVFDQTNGMVDLGGETDGEANDATSAADRDSDTGAGDAGPMPFSSGR